MGHTIVMYAQFPELICHSREEQSRLIHLKDVPQRKTIQFLPESLSAIAEDTEEASTCLLRPDNAFLALIPRNHPSLIDPRSSSLIFITSQSLIHCERIASPLMIIPSSKACSIQPSKSYELWRLWEGGGFWK